MYVFLLVSYAASRGLLLVVRGSQAAGQRSSFQAFIHCARNSEASAPVGPRRPAETQPELSSLLCDASARGAAERR